MRKPSTSPSHIRLAALVAMYFMANVTLLAQGSSIPTTSAVKEQRAEGDATASATLPEGQKYRYATFNAMSVSFNLFPPVMNLFGKDYGSYEGTLTIDLHRRFFPQATAGVGYCNAESDDFVRYHSKMRPFLKAGMLYNFKYNEPAADDIWGVLMRVGYAYSEADVSNLYYTDAFWGETGPMSIDGMKFHSVWMELGGFIKVQISKHLSAGWDLSWKPFLHRGSVRQGKPYFVPGYGVTTSQIGMGFHVYFDL
ncbi:MAG: DUF6048 family protein [Bacteroidales bacterium]|nr:DUF6048 family protein [Bacteroidales bacterium]